VKAGKIETAFAVIVQLAMAIGLWIAAVWCWPDGIGSIPLASLTLGNLGMDAGSFLLVLLGVAAVAKAFTDPNG
jgi:hypothetical protein